MTWYRRLKFPALVLRKQECIKVLPFDFRYKAFGKLRYGIEYQGHMTLQFVYILFIAISLGKKFSYQIPL